MPVSPKQSLDPNDGIAIRAYLESLRSWLSGDRSTWQGQWSQLSDFFAPRSSRITYSDTNRGDRRDYSIINETGYLALRTLQAGMLSGMSSSTRPWFKTQAQDPALNDQQAVKVWCEEVDERVREVFLKSNVYQSLLNMYGEEGLYGTSAFMVLEDKKSVIRCHPYPIGIGGDSGYFLMMDDTLRIDGCIRIMEMSVRQMVDRFGFANVSHSMQVQYTSNAGGNKEQRYPVVHALLSGNYFGPAKDGGFKPEFPWRSIYYEMGSYNDRQGLLSTSGFYENPLVCGRWHVVGENTYGESAGMQCLGSVMSLQAWEERIAQATEKMFNPPIIVGTDIDPRRVSTLPGDIMFADTKDVSKIMTSAYQIDFRIEGGLQQIQRIEQRINDAMYRSLFQMFSESDRRDITAEEIRARATEKMQVLGPVVERNVEEVLAPLVKRTVGIMERQGLLPPLPPELHGQPIKLEFISILAQGQKLLSVNNVTQFLAIVGNEVAVDQGILDNVDLDEATRQLADKLSVPGKIVRTPEQVAQIRADRQKQQQMAQAAENAQKLAGAAANLANAPVGTGSLLDKAIPALSGGSE